MDMHHKRFTQFLICWPSPPIQNSYLWPQLRPTQLRRQRRMPTQSSHTETHPNDSKTWCQEAILQDVHTHKNIIQSLFVKPIIFEDIWGVSIICNYPMFAPCVLTSMLRIVPWHHFTRQLCDLCKRIHHFVPFSGENGETQKKRNDPIVRTSGWKFSSRGRTRCVRQLTCPQREGGCGRERTVTCTGFIRFPSHKMAWSE